MVKTVPPKWPTNLGLHVAEPGHYTSPERSANRLGNVGPAYLREEEEG